MIKYILVAVLMVLIMIGVSGGVEAKENVPNLGRDVICATLAFNAGYQDKGEWYFRERIAQHYDEHKVYIKNVVEVTHRLVSQMSEEFDEHPVQIYRDVFNDKCLAPFA